MDQQTDIDVYLRGHAEDLKKATAEGKASISEMQQTAESASAAMEALGVRSTAVIKAEALALEKALGTIKRAFGENSDDYKIAEAGYLKKITALFNEVKPAADSAGESVSSFGNAFRGLDAQLLQMAGLSERNVRFMATMVSSFGGVAAAALAAGSAMVVAYAQGQQESEALARSVIMSGEAAGVSSARIQALARDVAAGSASTQAALSKTLGMVVESGNITADNFAMVTQVATDMERVAGKSAQETVREFSEIGAAPVEAVVKLNEKYNFLTASVYQQIQALEEEGKTSEAVRVAQEAFGQAWEDRSQRLMDDLGTLSRLWQGLKETAAGAWDAMLDAGRKDGGQVSREDYEKAKATLEGKGYLSGGLLFGGESEARALVALYEAQAEAQKKGVAAANEQRQAQKDLVDLGKMASGYADKEEKKRREIAELNQRYASATKAAGVDQVALAAQYEQSLAGINVKYAEKEKRTAASRQSVSEEVKEAQELEKLLARINGKDMGLEAGYVKNVELMIKGWQRGRMSLEEYREAFALYVAMQPGAVAAEKATAEALKDAEKRRADYVATLTKETEALLKKAQAAEDENATIGLTTEELQALTARRYDERIALLEADAARLRGNESSQAELFLIEQQISALGRLKSAEVARPALKAQAQEWENFSRDIERSLTDSLYRAFENGEDAGQALAKSLQNTFKTMVLKVTVQAVVNVGAGAVSSLFGGSSGTGGTAGAVGGVGNLLSSGSSLYNAFSGGGMMGSFTAGMASVGSEALLGSAFVGPSATLATGAVGAGAQVGSMFGTAASGIATAIPYVGAVLAIAGALGAFDDSDIPQSGGNQAWYLGGSSFDNQQVRDRELSGGMSDEIKSGFDTLSQGLADMLKTVGASEADVTAYWYHMLNNEGKSGTFAARLFAGNPYEQSKAEQEMLYELKGKLKADGSNLASLLAEAYTGMAKAAIGASDLSDGTKELTTYLLDNGMAVEALTANWESITQWVDSLANLNAQADESAAALVKLAGGLDAFQSVTGTYYATYFSEAEQIEILTGQLQARFDDLGLVMPDVDAAGVSAEALRAEFRGLVEGLDVTTEAGQETFVRLMALAPAFSQVADAVGAVSDASAAAAEQARQAAAELMVFRIGANVQDFQSKAQSGLAYLQQAASLEMQRAQAAQQAAQESISSIESIMSSLSSAATSLYGAVDSSAGAVAGQGMGQIDAMLAAARNGFLPEPDELAAAMSSARAGLSADRFDSQADFEKAQLVLAGKFSQLQELAGKQLPVAERALAVANGQLTAAEEALALYEEQINALMGVEDATWNLSGTLEEVGQAIVEALEGQAKAISDSIVAALAAGRIGAADAATQLGGLGYTDTLKNGIAAGSNGAVIAGGNLYATNGWSGSVDAARRIVAETFGAVSPKDFYTAALGVGLSGRMIEQMYDMPAGTAAAWAKANGLPAFKVGTDFVPQDMLALVHRGEKITPAAYAGAQERLLAQLVDRVGLLLRDMGRVADATEDTAVGVHGGNRQPVLVEMEAG